MIQVDLTPEQAAELKVHYTRKLEKIQERTSEILNLLKAIGEEPVATEQTRAEQQRETTEQKVRDEKPTKPKWSDYIIKLLKERKRGVSSDQIFKSYMKEHGVAFPDPKPVKNTLSFALHYLQHTKNLIEGIPRKGKRGNVYRLATEKKPEVEVKQPPAPEKKKPVMEEKKLPAPEKKKPLPEKPKKAKPKKAPPAKPAKTSDIDTPETKYIQFVNDTLQKEKRILNRDEFVRYAMVYFNLPQRNKISTRGKVFKTLVYMEKDAGTLKKAKKKNQKGIFYGLSEWFDDENRLIPEFK